MAEPAMSAPSTDHRPSRLERLRRQRTRQRPRAPRWSRLAAAAGAVLMVTSGSLLVGSQALLARYEGVIDQRDLFGDGGPQRSSELTGPMNILLAGIDTRPERPDEVPRSDSVIVVHLAEGLDAGYLISLPRDTVVDIPAFPATGYPGGRDRLNAAIFHGAQPIGEETTPDVARGFALLAATVRELTGIERFDAGAVINFTGFEDVVDALGGVTVDLDERVVSRHRQPDGAHRRSVGGEEGYAGPQMVYDPGVHELVGWMALDLARQRYSLADGDYGRQRNQQRLIQAMLEKAVSRDVVTNPVALDRVLRAAGESLIFDGRGNGPVDFAFALREVRAGSLVMIGLPGQAIGSGDGYQGEELQPLAYDLFDALEQGRLEEFILSHPDLVS